MKRDNKLIMIYTLCNGIGQSVQWYFATIKAGLLVGPIASALMLGVFFGTSAVFSILFGKLSDHLKKRKIFAIIGSLFSGILTMQYFFINDFIGFLLFSFLMGIAISIISSTVPALHAEIDPDAEKGNLMSLYNISNSAGWAVGTFIGEILFVFVGYYIFIIWGLAPIFAAFTLLTVNEDHLDNAKMESELVSNNSHYDMIKPFLIFLAVILAFRHCASQGTISSLVPNYLVLILHATEIERGFIYSLNTFLQVAIMLPVGRLVDKLGRKNVLFMGVTFTTIAAFGYGLCINPWQVIPFQICIAVGWTCLINSSSAYVIDVTTDSNRAKGVGYLNAGLAIGGTAGPFLASLSLFMFLGSFQWSFIFLSLFGIPGIILCLLIKEDKKNHVYQILGKKSVIKT